MADDMNVAAEMASMRGEQREALARLEGRMDLLIHMQQDNQTHVTALDAKVSALEARRIPIAPLAALSGAMSAAVSVLALVVKP